jgi:sugar lactone lactonase YvrE
MILAFLLGCPPVEGDDTASTADAECTQTSGNICTWAGLDGLAALGQDGVQADESYLYLPQDVDFAPDGTAYLLDWNNHRIRSVGADGVVETIAGSGLLGDGPEGDARLAMFNHPSSVAFDLDGSMLVAAWHNSRVERIDLATNVMTYVAGDGSRSFAGDEGAANVAKLDLPSSVAVDSGGVIYISDTANQRIRSVTPDGIIHTYAGTGTAGFAGDGGDVLTAQFSNAKGQQAAPSGRITISPDDILYVADTLNQRVRAIDLVTNTVSTLAGSGTPGFSGDGGPATAAALFSPSDVAVGPDGEVYIADTENSCVRVVDTDGTIGTFAGICAEPDYTGDGGPATEARMQKPFGVAVDSAGNVYVSDTYNNVIRVVWR